MPQSCNAPASLFDMSQRRIQEINSLSCVDFTSVIGPTFEHSPWIAEMTWGRKPFADLEQLHRELCETVKNAGTENHLALIRAHPDLAGRLALAGELTKESASEQAGAGLDRLTPDELSRFQNYNAAYQARFNFPFVICARLNKKDAILAGFERRLVNSPEEEIKTALEEIFKIAELRLRNLVGH